MPPKYHLICTSPCVCSSISRANERDSRAHSVPSGATVAKRSTCVGVARAADEAQRDERATPRSASARVDWRSDGCATSPPEAAHLLAASTRWPARYSASIFSTFSSSAGAISAAPSLSRARLAAASNCARSSGDTVDARPAPASRSSPLDERLVEVLRDLVEAVHELRRRRHQHLPQLERQRIDRRVRHHQARRQHRRRQVGDVARLGRPLIGERRRRHGEEARRTACAATPANAPRSSSPSSCKPISVAVVCHIGSRFHAHSCVAISSSSVRIGVREKSTSMPNTASPRLAKPDLRNSSSSDRLEPAHHVDRLVARVDTAPAGAPRAATAPAAGRRSRPPRRRAARA